jgi:hypothetical protein
MTMAKIMNNPLLKGASGMLGGTVVFREVRGTVIMAKRPSRPRVLTDHQRNAKAKFLRGVEYARKQLADPVTRAKYAAGITDRKFSAFLVALTDSLTAPSIQEIDISGYRGQVDDRIIIRAIDDFEVATVHVMVSDSTGAIIEQGYAVHSEVASDEWCYTTTAVNTITAGIRLKVSVSDRPGNITIGEKVLEQEDQREAICPEAHKPLISVGRTCLARSTPRSSVSDRSSDAGRHVRFRGGRSLHAIRLLPRQALGFVPHPVFPCGVSPP